MRGRVRGEQTPSLGEDTLGKVKNVERAARRVAANASVDQGARCELAAVYD